MSEEVEIKNLTWREDSHSFGWEWEVANEQDGTTRYCTDRRGEGLFQWGVWGGDISPTWRQQKGTIQFSVPVGDEKLAKARIKKFYTTGV